MKDLLSSGADVNKTDSEGYSALDDAEINKNTEIINLLKSAGSKQ